MDNKRLFIFHKTTCNIESPVILTIQSKVRGEYETNWQRTNVWMLFDVKK